VLREVAAGFSNRELCASNDVADDRLPGGCCNRELTLYVSNDVADV